MKWKKMSKKKLVYTDSEFLKQVWFELKQKSQIYFNIFHWGGEHQLI